MTGWHGKQRDFQNNEKTMEHSDHLFMLSPFIISSSIQPLSSITKLICPVLTKHVP